MDKRSLLFMVCVVIAFSAVQLWFNAQQPSPLPPNPKYTAQLDVFQEAPLIASAAQIPTPSQETFYVLENDYQQLVFSTQGGALAEINLPLKQSKHSKSIVKEIDIDREILAQSPQNARFPLYPFYTPKEGGGTIFHAEGALGGYYPLLRRSILDTEGSAIHSVSPEYYAFNIIGHDLSLASLNYKVTRFEPTLIQFTASIGSRTIVKTFSIPQKKNGPYCFLLDVQIDGEARGLWLSSGIPDVELVGGSYSPLLRYQISKGPNFDVETVDLPKQEPTILSSSRPNWISNCNGFLGIILDPLSELQPGYRAEKIPGDKIPTRLSIIDAASHLYPPADYPGYATYLPLQSDRTPWRIFAGPFDHALLQQLDDLYANPLKNYNPDYTSAQSMQGWFSFISQPFSTFLFFLMRLFYAVTGSWAVSILLLTIALRILMYPLNAWSIRSIAKSQALAPKIKAIQDRYKKDPKKAHLEMAQVYKEAGVNPLLGGCLPMLLQTPFLFGMFYLLKSSFPLRGAPFILGWIDDLAAPDILFSWGPPLWFIGNEFHLLPILMGLSMYLQQRWTSNLPQDVKQLSDAQKQQKMMGNIMPILFTAMFYNAPSGLNIYFMFSTLLGIAQQWWMTKKKPRSA